MLSRDTRRNSWLRWVFLSCDVEAQHGKGLRRFETPPLLAQSSVTRPSYGRVALFFFGAATIHSGLSSAMAPAASIGAHPDTRHCLVANQSTRVPNATCSMEPCAFAFQTSCGQQPPNSPATSSSLKRLLPEIGPWCAPRD